jgi:MYXO-CTERM domain-containing protein
MTLSRSRAPALSATLALAALLSASTAQAFCGFYVSPGDQKLTNNATMVVLMREGQRTVLSMQNDYQGPPSDFAMVVPVPIVLQKENVRTLPREVFDHVDQMASPRLVEYWEQNPCPDEREKDDRKERVAAAPPAPGAMKAAAAEHDLGVKIEAEFVVGEYEVVVLSARDSDGLDTWLRQNQYKIPEGAEPVLRPYVAKGMKFFVAKVISTKVKFENGRAVLSPLRFHYDADDFSLPVRLGLLNSNGKQELVVHILARNKRYEMANYPNVTIPTNLDVSDEVKERFGPFYAALFDATLEKHPGAVVTEYSWDASTCDPCPGPTLGPTDITTLGADALSTSTPPPNLPTDPSLRPVVELGEVRATGAFSERGRGVVDRYLPMFTRCYVNELARAASPKGTLKISLTLNGPGKPPTFVSSNTPSLPPSVSSCADYPFRRGYLGLRPDQTGTLEFSLRFDLEKGPPEQGWWKPPPTNTWGFTLTRLHTRYAKETLGQDLIFREAPPIVGGREIPTLGEQDHEAKPATTNNFQARYVIRHAWAGPIACATPKRGVWGGPPPGVQGSTQPKAASKIAYVPRGGVELASMLKQAVPALGIVAPPAGGAKPSAGGACACAMHEEERPLAPALLALLGAAALRRRRAARPRL